MLSPDQPLRCEKASSLCFSGARRDVLRSFTNQQEIPSQKVVLRRRRRPCALWRFHFFTSRCDVSSVPMEVPRWVISRVLHRSDRADISQWQTIWRRVAEGLERWMCHPLAYPPGIEPSLESGGVWKTQIDKRFARHTVTGRKYVWGASRWWRGGITNFPSVMKWIAGSNL